MTQLERQQNILAILRKMGPDRSISVKELAAMLYTSQSSVRRDIAAMSSRGLLTHVYGGVMLEQYKNSVMPVSLRDTENLESKELIARQAAELIRSGDTVFLDSSSTSSRILKYIGDKTEIRIITNNLKIFSELDSQSIQLYCTGGTYNPKNHNFLGHAAEAYIQKTSADIMFFSSLGLSECGEINDISEAETAIKTAMLARASKKIFLCDSSKVGISKLLTICTLDDVDEVICDKPELIQEIRAKRKA